MLGSRWAVCAMVLGGCADDGAQGADGTSSSSSSSGASVFPDPLMGWTTGPEDITTGALDTETSSSSDSTSSSSDSTSSSSDSTSSSSDSTSSSSTTDASSSSSSSTTGDACMAMDVGNAVPTSVALDNTGAGNDYVGSCWFDFGGEDLVVDWTAPAAGTYYFTTSRPGTMINGHGLAVHDGDCGGLELACGMRFLDGSLVGFATADLAADQTVAIVIDGYDGMDVGMIELYIDEYPAPQSGGSCCNSSDMGGCDVDPVEECVCSILPECCDDTWSSYCAQQSYDFCNATCACWEWPQCDAPSDDCICMGCTIDGVCDAQDDCIDCSDCEGSMLCGCNDNDVCDPYSETCDCADCADEAVCA